MDKAEIMQHETLAEALLHAQIEYPPLDKSSTVNVTTAKGGYSYTYADLAYTKRMTDPYLWKHGLVIHSKNEFRDDKEFVVSILIHIHSKERECSEIEVTESKDMKVLGANITYARRYNYWNLSGRIGEDDSEGRPTERQRRPQERTRRPTEGTQKPDTGNKASRTAGELFSAIKEVEREIMKASGQSNIQLRRELLNTDVPLDTNDEEAMKIYLDMLEGREEEWAERQL